MLPSLRMPRTMGKPNCYKCVHRRSIPGDAHSSCHHPSLKALNEDPIAVLMGLLGKRAPHIKTSDYFPNAIKVEGNPHGIAQGWFAHPFNYDPTWLEKCDGFTEKVNDAVTSCR